MPKTNRIKLFAELCTEAAHCRLCPALADRRAFLSDLNGTLAPDVFFLAEAPGRIGTVQERQPFSDSKSGANFQIMLDSINLSRDRIFITNAALCNPQSQTGANRKPTKTEIKNCSGLLRKQFALIDPPLIATLGSVGLEALKAIEYHNFTLRENAGQILRWNDRLLVPLYHPSPQVTASHRRLHQQVADFQSIEEALCRIE